MTNSLETEKTSQGVLDQIILGVAHELNNPNAFVRMNITNLKKMFWLLKPVLDEYEEQHPDAEFGPYSLPDLRTKMNQQMEGILGATVRIIVIADRLKQCTSESLEQAAVVSFREIVTAMLAEHEFLFERCTGVTFDNDSQQPFNLSGYRLQLEQAVSVLLTNACDAIVEQFGDAGRTEGHLEVSLRADGNHMVLQVTDNGCGMSKKNREKAFVPYFTTKPQGTGDGLGLAICRSVVQRHEGTIDLTSEIGQGTTFTIKLPMMEE